ncbi:terminase small subunit protein [Ochrobactrum sp. S1502_03]|uniref:terminase small subunit-like protein n=1 Tax=Ochrobactrum sp. S1502_03 TaxID=3108451 RepID=UPI0037CA7CBE
MALSPERVKEIADREEARAGQPVKTGRPSKRTPEMEEAIINGLMDGYSLVQICASDTMPNRRTILRWMEDDEAFATRCARAREIQADLMDDKIIQLIDDVNVENASAMRVKLSALQWRAAKLAPKKYGDKQEVEHTGQVIMIAPEASDL